MQWQRRIGLVDLGLEWRVHERRMGSTLACRGLSLRIGADRLGGQSRSREFLLAWTSGF